MDTTTAYEKAKSRQAAEIPLTPEEQAVIAEHEGADEARNGTEGAAPFLTSEQIRQAATGGRLVPVHWDALGGRVMVRILSGPEQVHFVTRATAVEEGDDAASGELMRDLVLDTLCDDEGRPLFLDDPEVITNLPGEALADLFHQVMTVNGFSHAREVQSLGVTRTSGNGST